MMTAPGRGRRHRGVVAGPRQISRCLVDQSHLSFAVSMRHAFVPFPGRFSSSFNCFFYFLLSIETTIGFSQGREVWKR